MTDEFQTIMKLLLVVVILVVLALTAVFLVPNQQKTAIQAVQQLMPVASLSKDPCQLHCYAMQENKELNLITGGPLIERTRGRDYSSALILPEYFSCNYQMLELATQAIELARWEMKKPVVYFSGINCSDYLFVHSKLFDLINTPPIPLCIQLCSAICNSFPAEYLQGICDNALCKPLDLASSSLDCDLAYNPTSGTMKLVCPTKNCTAANLTFIGEYESIDYLGFTDECVAKRTTPGYNDFLTSFDLCKLMTEQKGERKCIVNPDYHSTCDRERDSCQLMARDSGVNYCKENVMNYSGNAEVACDFTCTLDSSDEIICDSPKGCKTDFLTESCNPPYVSCNVNYDSDSCTVNSAVPSISCNTTAGGPKYPCAVVYSANTCSLICDPSVSVNKLSMTDYFIRLLNLYIDEQSPDQFEKIVDFKILNVRVINRTHQGGLFDLYTYHYPPLFDIIVQPDDYMLLPRLQVSQRQEGLRSHFVTWNMALMASGQNVRDVSTYFTGEVTNPRYIENASKFIYDCVNTGICDDTALGNFKNYCLKDDFLSEYSYINCLDTRTFDDKLNPSRLNYIYRTGNDLKHNFTCTHGPYDACNMELNKYGENCRPPWLTLATGEGRCEDFALMYYTLFKTLGVPEDKASGKFLSDVNVSLKMGHCTMPCACKLLAESCGFYYEQTGCATPQYVIVRPFGVINACDPLGPLRSSYPIAGTKLFEEGTLYSRLTGLVEGESWLNGSTYNLIINKTNYIILQNFTKESVYLYKNFDDELDYFMLGPEVSSANYGGNSIIYNNELCNAYTKILNTQQLITECKKYALNPDEFEIAANEMNNRGMCD